MPVAAIYDIHANLPALDAVLQDIHRLGADRVIVGGDVLPGPMPREALTRLLRFDIPVQFIYGNGEVAVLEYMAGRIPAKVPEQHRPIIQWTAEQLDPEYQKVLASWPAQIRVQIPGFDRVMFCHATPRNEDECFTRLTSSDLLLPLFEEIGAAVVVCGHTHMQFDRMVGTTRVVNAGSVGMPFGEPGADWLLIGPDIQLRHTTYDLEKAAEQIRATAYPQAPHFALNSVLHPPTEAEMLDLFARAELRG